MSVWIEYVRIARPSHWFKNIFVLPGILLAFFFQPLKLDWPMAVTVLVSLIGSCLVASSNYVLNEILDAAGDAHHPDKKHRPIPSGRISLPIAYMEWLILGAAGIGIGAWVNWGLFASLFMLWIMGLLYNVPPIRCKDTPYLDVLSESVNNPIRMAIGWFGTGLTMMPTLSVLLAYWMFGAFLMAVKRFAEYRHIADAKRSSDYRRSFCFYNEERLLVSILFYVALFGMFSGVFIARYRVELVLAIPFVGLAMASYYRMGFKPDSPAMNPEEMWRYPSIIIPVGLAFLICSLCLFLDIPFLPDLFSPRFPVEGFHELRHASSA
jgi:decaprenyl-phosphate phosphoribosyltransferase